MKRKLRNRLLLCGAFVGSLALLYPCLSSLAQKNESEKPEKQQQQNTALETVRQNLVTNSFYGAIETHEKGWMLVRADHTSGPPPDERVKGHYVRSFNLVLKHGKLEARVGIYEYPSEADAKFPFEMKISRGFRQACQGAECGDEGQKAYAVSNKKTDAGIFQAFELRKGRYFVSIFCESQEVAKRFARYAIAAIEGR